MSEDIQGRALAIVVEAIEKPEAQRLAFAQAACGGDEALLREVQSLLDSHARAGHFLTSPTAAPSVPMQDPPSGLLREGSGTVIGRYKLLQLIGEGGFGSVFMAEQETPVHRKVALKIIKLGMDTKQVVARFEAERQALAIMDHPHIAKVLDAGATETGRPYFVMELVRGVPITDYCDTNNLPLSERLELFVQVCQAVQHAHTKGIIHRDLKPSNVMITMADGRPSPKVIDFGIAKAIDQRLTEKTVFTEFRQMIGTPQYMSPEQAEMAGIDIDTRSDVYSLGVLLYELLVGSTPFDPKELRSKAYGEMQRMIREVEPQRPSTRLSSRAGTLPSIAAHRRIEPAKLGQVLKGELDWIVMRAMEKDRTRRYESANGLASDVDRYLAGEAVMAAPQSKTYQISKFVRRNKGPVAAAGLVAAALLLGVAGTTLGLLNAQRQRTLAEHRLVDANAAKAAEAEERRKAEENERAASKSASLAHAKEKEAQAQAIKSQQVATFLQEMLAGVAPRAALGRDTTLLREILDRTAARVSKSLKDQPEVQAEILRTLAGTYADLDDNVRSEQTTREVLRLRRSIFKGDHPATADALQQQADALRHLCYGDGHEASLREAEGIARQAVAMRERLGGQSINMMGRAMNTLAVVLGMEGRHGESEQVFRKLLAMGFDTERAHLPQGGLARALRAQGRFTEAIVLHHQELAILRKWRDASPRDLIWPLRSLGDTLQAAGDLKGAEDAYREGLTIAQRYYSANHSRVKVCAQALIQVYRTQGRSADATALEKQLRENEKTTAPPLDLPDVPDGDAIEMRSTSPARTSTTNPAAQSLFATISDGDDLARAGDFRGAAAEFLKQLAATPDDSLAILQIGALLAEDGQSAAFREYCQKMLALHAQSRDVTILRRLAKVCLVAPVSAADTQTAAKLADLALAASVERKFAVQARLIKGLAEYRLGDNTAAIQWMKQVIDDPGEPISPVTSDITVAANAIVAAACHKLHDTNKARDALSQATDGLKDRWLGPTVSELPEHWLDMTIAHVLLREARQMIEK